MGLLWTVIIGLVVGALAKFVTPGNQNMGLLFTALLGIGGSVLATYLGQLLGLYEAGQGAGFIGAVVGAVLILYIYGRTRGATAAG